MPDDQVVRCRESERIDADRVCQLWVGVSPRSCPSCARNESWPEGLARQDLPPGQVLVVPAQFTSLMIARFHVERFHGLWGGDFKTLRTAVKEHAAMHDGEQNWPRPVTHIHEAVGQITIWHLT
jgi:hypothetical protein